MWRWREFYWNIVNYWRLLSNKAPDEKHRSQTYMKDALTLFDFLEPSFFRATTKFKSWPLITKSWPVIMKISSCHRENLDLPSWRSQPVRTEISTVHNKILILHNEISTCHKISWPIIVKFWLFMIYLDQS